MPSPHSVSSLSERTARTVIPDDTVPLLDQTPVDGTHRNEEEGAALVWRNLEVQTVAGRTLLKGVSGIAVPGKMTALMGASGAGKTTLLNALLSRNLKGLEVKGEILVNGQEIGRGVTKVSAYVQQEDLFVGTLTVGEHLYQQANMRLPSSMSKEQKQERLDRIIREMVLENCVNSRIGVPGLVKGISGGELKRLAFASELLADPPIIFADEPTTGLDSHMAMSVAKKMESLSNDQGKAIICTIHQPASEIFELFDRVLFLAGGRTAFFGTPPEAIQFFMKCGYPVPDHVNPADHCIQTIAIQPGDEEACRDRCREICQQFEDSPYRLRMQEEMEEFSQPRPLEVLDKVKWTTLFAMLFLRYIKGNSRTMSVIPAKHIQKVFMGLFIGSLYSVTKHDQDGLSNLKGILFYYISELSYSTVFSVQTYMPGDFPLLVREYHSGIFPVSAYILARASLLFYFP